MGDCGKAKLSLICNVFLICVDTLDDQQFYSLKRLEGPDFDIFFLNSSMLSLIVVRLTLD